MSDLIKKLKDPKLAQPFGILSTEKREILRKARSCNCLLYVHEDKWSTPDAHTFLICTNTYILKPNYQPEPEYVDLEIVESSSLLGTLNNGVFCPLYKLPSLPNFELFWYDDGNTIRIDFGEVAHRVIEGKTVYARFRKE